jgi:uncharacterized protein YegP (UPF0339 family)
MMEHMSYDELAEVDLTEDDLDAMLAAGEPVEITGPPETVPQVRYELVRVASSAYRWRLVSQDGEILATSAVAYRSRDALRQALVRLTSSLANAPIVEFEDVRSPVPDQQAG